LIEKSYTHQKEDLNAKERVVISWVKATGGEIAKLKSRLREGDGRERKRERSRPRGALVLEVVLVIRSKHLAAGRGRLRIIT
jgi:hypothetical protein